MVSRMLCSLAVASVVAACVSSTASAADPHLVVSLTHAGDATVVQLRNAGGVARGIVRWGDGRSTIAARACGPQVHADGKAATLFAPHVFRSAGTYHGVALVTRACTGANLDRRRISFIVRAGPSRHLPAHAAAAASSSDGWTSFDQPDALANSQLTYVQGAVTSDGGCLMPGGSLSSADLAPGATSVEQREDAIDPATCTYLYETGTPPPDDTADAGSGSGQSSSTASATADQPASAVTTVHAATVASHTAHLYTAWRDPVDITVNSMKQDEYWSDNGSCVLSSSGSTYWTWYSPSGWFDYGGSESNNISCYHGIDTVYHAMGNHIFCVGGLVNSYYNVNNLAGHGDGGWAANWNDYNTGAVCKDLLHFAETAGYGS